LRFSVRDELITTSHEYNASRNVLEFAAARDGAKVVVVSIPFPGTSPADVLDRIVSAVTPRTRFALVDHVTSQTALVFPIASIVRELSSRGIDTFVDGAHAPGMLPLEIEALGCAYYTGNCHKWICAPKGAALLYVREELRPRIRPAAISHGASSTRTDRSRFHLEFDWTGTFDPTPWLTVPFAIEYVGSLLPGGWPALRNHNRRLALEARSLLCASLDVETTVPDEMIGSMAAVPLPDGNAGEAPSLYGDPLQDTLLEQFGIEVPIVPWPGAPHRLIRVSAQLYNQRSDYEALAMALESLL
jgi:Selenocysteine lyase